jgi:hypothetical protein
MSDADNRAAPATDTAMPLPSAVAQLLDDAGFTEEPVDAVAEQLHAVNDSRRERLRDLSREVPGLDVLLAAMPTDMPMAALAGFVDTPQPDLTSEDGLLTPLQWLQKGGDVAEVVRLLELADWSSR